MLIWCSETVYYPVVFTKASLDFYFESLNQDNKSVTFA